MKKSIIICTCFLLAGMTLQARPITAPTDYFRSIASGEWNDPFIWESSVDNINWVAANSWPGSAANTISIRNGHFVNVSNNQDMDQVVIENGGVLSHLGNTLTINDGAGDDIIVQNGGVLTLASVNNAPVFAVPTATANINTGAILRLATTGLTFPGVGVNADNYIYQHQSVLEYTPNLAFATSGVTFFPNVNSTTIPIFRTIGNVGMVGGGSPTIINGLFEANGSITWVGTGTKTFRNGIIGTGNINGSGSGTFIINGTTAEFGGTGTLIVSAANGMDIGANTTVTMVSNKIMTGTINLLPANSLIILGNYDLDLIGNVTGGSATSHIVTNGTGKLILNLVSGATPRIFPVGANATTINPMAIFNGGGFSYGVRVETGINPNISVPLNAVNRTWFVTPSGGTPATVNTNFFYYAGDGNAGFNYTANLELGLHTGVWNVIQTNLIPAGSYQVATTVSSFGNNIESPLVLGNLGAILASNNAAEVNYFTGVKQNGSHVLKWKLNCSTSSTVNMQIERSADGSNYFPLYAATATALRCEQPFSFSDNQPVAGANYYRIQLTDDAGKVTYSSIVVLLNAVSGIEVMGIAPNPVLNGSCQLKISAAKRTSVMLMISDMQGRVLQQQSIDLVAGFNSIPVNTAALAKGTYQLVVHGDGIKMNSLRFVVQ